MVLSVLMDSAQRSFTHYSLWHLMYKEKKDCFSGLHCDCMVFSGIPRNFVGGGGGSSLVRGSGGSCNLVQEISFHTVKFS